MVTLRGFVNLLSRNLYSFSDVSSFSPVLQNVHFNVVVDNGRKYCTAEANLRKDESPSNKSNTDKQRKPTIIDDTGLYRAFVKSNCESLFQSGLNENEVDKKLRSQWNVMSTAEKRCTKLGSKNSRVPRSSHSTAFEVFVKLNFHVDWRPGVSANVIVTELGRQWRAMSVPEKGKYEKLAVEDSAVIRKKFLDFVSEMPLSEISDGTMKKLKVWLNFPIQPYTAYSTFIGSCLANKKFSGGLSECVAAMRELGPQWNSFSDTDKQVYVDKYRVLLAEYKINHEEWQSQMKNKGNPFDKIADLILEYSKEAGSNH